MQKNVNNALVLTEAFVQKFKSALIRYYGYDAYMDFLIVSSLAGAKTLAYLPLLNYTDREYDEVEDLLELAKDNAYQIRTLNFSYDAFEEHDTVTMRLDIDEKSSERVFAENVKSRCRNKVRNADKKYDYRLEYGHSFKDIEAFYEIFSETMHKHGTPVLARELFHILAEEFSEDIIFFNLYDNTQVVAAMCIIVDEKIVWYPWGGVKTTYANKLAGYKIYWEVLRYICDETDKKIFDFGRSSYGGATYKFKSQFGAAPVKIDILTSQQSDIYAKYSFASRIWKRLPKKIVDFLGPKLCRFLVDL